MSKALLKSKELESLYTCEQTGGARNSKKLTKLVTVDLYLIKPKLGRV
jgi:hypothetical protein